MRDSAQNDLHFLSLFSGCGGFDLGFEKAGFKSLGAFDIDKCAVNNFNRNLVSTAQEQDLLDGFPDSALNRNPTVVIAGPPCQGFSTAGKRVYSDERNHLLTHAGHLAVRLNPKIIVIENVPGVIAGKHAIYWRNLKSYFVNSGYRVNEIKIQVTDIGMAQIRKRMLLFAWNTGREFKFLIPKLQHKNLIDVLSELDGVENHRPRELQKGTELDEIASKIRPGQKLSNVRGGNRAVHTWDIPRVFGPITDKERILLELIRKLRRQDRRRSFGDADPVSLSRLSYAFGKPFQRLLDSLEKKGYIRKIGDDVDLKRTFNGKFRRLEWDAPSCTVDTRFGEPRYFLHPSENRGFTVREAARIQGFPDSYIFQGDEKSQYRIIGNAVPPPLAELTAQWTRSLLVN